MRLYIARHGESEANRLKVISNRDLPHGLTDAGRRQALEMAGQLAPCTISRVVASPILRACQTGEILAEALLVPLSLADGLREPDCGMYEGRGDSEAWLGHRSWLETWLTGQRLDEGPPEGETCSQVQKRFMDFLNGLLEEFRDSPTSIVLITHGEAMLLSLPGLADGLTAELIFEKYLEHGSVL